MNEVNERIEQRLKRTKEKIDNLKESFEKPLVCPMCKGSGYVGGSKCACQED